MNLRVNDTQLSKNLEVATTGIYVGDSKLKFDPYFSFEENVLKFSYLNFDQENFRINILSENNDLVYQSRLGNNLALTNGFDLSKLEAGNYRIVLSSFKNEYVYSIEK